LRLNFESIMPNANTSPLSPADPAPASQTARTQFGRDVIAGLRHETRRLAPKYFYDVAGSALFDRICELPEYYPTRTEIGILRDNAKAIAAVVGPNAEVVEFGAGSLTKIRLLFDAFAAGEAPGRYLPVDISGEHLHTAAGRLQAEYPALHIQPVVADYTMPLILPKAAANAGRRVGFFPGSSLGNFQPDEALEFLRLAARLLQGGGLLVGVDLVKDPAVLHAAYNDRQGVTAAFNLNLLRRMNAELVADFDLDGFAHYAFYQATRRRVEMHLVSTRRQTVQIGEERFDFAEGDSILTEESHKFTVDSFRALAEAAGFSPGQVWVDEQRLFSVHWLVAR
jgi:dimethylhistidine N-methyltransferase